MDTGIVILSTVAFGLATLTSAQSMAKDSWLDTISLLGPNLIFALRLHKIVLMKKKLKKSNIDFDKCVNLLPDSIATCKSKLVNKIPTNSDNSSRKKWDNALGRCIGNDFSRKNLR